MAGYEVLRSPVIWRCASCGALVHPADENAPAAWCMRCGRVVPAERDGGDDEEAPGRGQSIRTARGGRAGRARRPARD